MWSDYAVFHELCDGDITRYDALAKQNFRSVLNELAYRMAKSDLYNYLHEQANQKNK